MVGNVDIPTPVESPTVLPVTPIATGSGLLILPVLVNKRPQEKLPLSPVVPTEVESPT